MEKQRTFTQTIPTVAFITAVILMIPFIAMQFNKDMNWSAFDFIIVGAIIFGIGTAFAYVVRKGQNLAYKAGVVVAFGTTLFMIWANLAVGLIASGPNFANLMYIGVVAISLIGTFVSGFKAGNMERTMYAAVFALVLIAAISLIAIDWLGNTSIVEILAINGFFATGYIIAALLFRAAAKRQNEV